MFDTCMQDEIKGTNRTHLIKPVLSIQMIFCIGVATGRLEHKRSQ